MIDNAALQFAPLVPWLILIGLGALSLVVLALGLWRRARGTLWRGVVLGLILLALANPLVVQEQRDPLSDVAVVVADRSPSQRIANRPGQLDEALEEVHAELDASGDLDVVEVELRGDGQGGTRLFEEVADAISQIDRDRLAGIVVLTDGQVHDAPDSPERLGIDAPVHALLTGRPDERDRRLVVEEVPSYAMVGDRHELQFRIEEQPGPLGTGPVAVDVRQDGELIQRLSVPPGGSATVPFEIARAGQSVLEIEAEAAEDELTLENNRAVHFVNGVRDRLRVLLVSGQPYPGLRVWRNLLKADPAVDLVHFTILRPPEKQDGTPIRELALIAFPSRELFEVKLGEFDLVIFDRYARRGLLPLAYLDNVARYVEDGGGLLEVAGPEFAHPLSLYRTPLASVLPARPSGVVYEQGFSPSITELGQRHPVTAGLTGSGAPADDPVWGRWFRQIDVEVAEAETLMSGVSEQPLLVLDRIGEGRVAMILSDHAWLWARGVEGGGPQGLLLRRLVHWLMKEPELEEEALRAEPRGNGIRIERRTLEEDVADVQVTTPRGETQSVPLEVESPGLAVGAFAADEPGLYRLSAGELATYVAIRRIGAEELQDMRATPERLAPLVEASGGAIHWLAEDGVPAIRRISKGREAAGRNWIGLERNERYLVTGASQLPLMPALLALSLLLGTLAFAWYREGR